MLPEDGRSMHASDLRESCQLLFQPERPELYSQGAQVLPEATEMTA